MDKRRKEAKEQAIVIYKDGKENVELRADVKKDTVWATQAQIVNLFGVDQSVVSRHIRNIFKDGEIEAKSNMQKMHIANSDKPVVSYSLDVILAVGYRTNSKIAIAFRKWATKTLREFLVKGYVLNQKRLEKSQANIKDLQKALGFMRETVRKRQLDQSEVDSLLSVISTYANSWLLLRQYDNRQLEIRKGKVRGKKALEYGYVRSAIDEMQKALMARGEASDLFGNEREGALGGILRNIHQTFGGKELYESVEEKAAHLLYFLIKDHPFSDGNKRIGSFLFILFLDKNGALYRANGERKIDENALTALALLVAESDPKDKDQMVALVTQLLA